MSTVADAGLDGMKITDVTVHLPSEEADFLQNYAQEHATSVADIFARYARRLHRAARPAPHPENLKFTGVVPAVADAREAHRRHLVEKHR